MALPVCPGCTRTIIPKPDDTCPNCGFKDVEKGLAAGGPSPAASEPAAPILKPRTPAEPEYGGFWIRFGAYWLDAFIAGPVTVLGMWLQAQGPRMIHASFVLGLSASIFFRVYCVKRWGGSPGKLICGLRVVKTSLQPVGWKEAWLRDSVWLAIAIVGQVVMIYAMNQITDSEFAQLGFMDRNRRIIELGGLPMQVVNWSTQLWAWGEFVVLLTNRERRALHDFIAGTIVVRK